MTFIGVLVVVAVSGGSGESRIVVTMTQMY